MAGEIMFGKCDVCGKEAPLQRKYYRYPIRCECHSPYHFEIVEHCADCTPEAPKRTTITIEPTDDSIFEKEMEKSIGKKMYKVTYEALIFVGCSGARAVMSFITNDISEDAIREKIEEQKQNRKMSVIGINEIMEL